ncbi:MAG: hypothetical protein GY754_26220, partial [bacterium]|nr:hypothetical protein [bacterium]
MRRRKKNPVKLLSLLLVQGMVLLGIGYVIFFSACEFDEYGEFRDDEFATLDEDGFQDYSLNVSTAARPACSSKKMQEILAPAKKAGHAAVVDCNLNLKKNNVITKRLIFQGKNATGVTMNCNNALLNGGYGTHNKGKDMIEVRSIRRNRNGVNTWERPERVTIKNCRVNGSIRIWGMATNGEGAYLRESSRRPGHIARARNNAPRIIVLSNLTISGVGRIPLYISPGVTHARVINSTFTGKSDSVTIYLDAESAANTIKNNKFHTQRTSKSKREVMAIDGSSHNTIMNNWFSGLNYGGIYLYRNCGEGGTVRHATPSYNKIINNIFYYNKYNKISAFPSIFLGSRQASSWYCNDDKGYRFGSSASNFDFATYNVVARNRFYKFTPQQAIRHGYPNVDIPNYFYQNARSDGAQ